MLTRDIKCAPPFSELFPVDPKVVESIKASISRDGFSDAEPVIIWRGKDILVDGHLRYLAAKELDYKHIPTFHMNFANEDEALRYAIHRQTLRRNLTDAEIIRCIEALDKRRERGGDHGNQYTGGKVAKASNGAIGKSAQETAKTVGVSRSKVERARTVLDKADAETQEAVREGKITINRAYQKTKAKSNPAAEETSQATATAAAQAPAVEPETAPDAPPQTDLHKQELRQALEELLAWRQKYRHLYELGNYFAAIDSFVRREVT